MSNGYGRIAFTPAVQDQQEHHGSRHFFDRQTARADRTAGPDPLTDEVGNYLSKRDSFYLASVSETGWPYIQFRGGPPGFLTVLSKDTIGWADFRGNLQYISSGNLHHDGRVALIVMDYPARRRLKIYGHATVHDAEEAPALVERLTERHYDAVIERAVVVRVEAYDWNCPRHITPRYILEEIREQTDTLRHRLIALEAENTQLRQLLTPIFAWGRSAPDSDLRG